MILIGEGEKLDEGRGVRDEEVEGDESERDDGVMFPEMELLTKPNEKQGCEAEQRDQRKRKVP